MEWFSGLIWTNATQYPSDLIVVLDLDECLIHCVGKDEEERENIPSTDIESFICQFRGGQSRRVLLRPGWRDFLQTVMTRYETYIFTAGYEDYAGPIVAALEEKIGRNLKFAGCYYRPSCRVQRHLGVDFTFKDLRTIRPWPSWRSTTRTTCSSLHKKMVLIDDDATNFQCNPTNGIPIRAFRGDNNANADGYSLATVLSLLQELEGVEDVRPVLSERFRLDKVFAVAQEIYQPLHLQWEHVYNCAADVQL
jgi:TFIIF-interacting CTD phosphatase-like protein